MSYDDEIMLVKVSFEKECVVHTHFHIHRQCTYVVSRIFEFSIDTETKIVKAGGFIIHETKCRTRSQVH